MIAQCRLLRLLANRQLASTQLRCAFSASEQPAAPAATATTNHEDLALKFEKDWSKIQKETETKQKQVLDAELTAAQKKRVEFIAEAFLELNIMETRFLNKSIKDKLLQSTGLSPFKLNVDWPSIKQLENGSWPPSNPNWVQQQETISKLWPAGQAGLQQLFGGMGTGSGGNAGSAVSSTGAQGAPGATAGAAAGAAAPQKAAEEAPKEKQNYDVELSAIDAASKIKIIKEVRALFNLGLKEAKDMVEKTPCVLKASCKKAEAEDLKVKLTALGCTINLL